MCETWRMYETFTLLYGEGYIRMVVTSQAHIIPSTVEYFYGSSNGEPLVSIKIAVLYDGVQTELQYVMDYVVMDF